jgi:hypothetical protein
VTSASGVESPIIITIAKKGDVYVGSTNGLNASSESALKRLTVDGAKVSLEAADDSKLGVVSLAADLALEGNTLKGAGRVSVGAQKFDVTLALQRRPRAEAIQPHVEQRVDYFVGRWKFEYLGAEYPPLSAGGRSGTMTFTRAGAANFVTGRLEGELLGKPYQEQMSIELDPETNMLAVVEKRPEGVELVSVASWRSPIAITFQTSPVQANGKTYQLRRLLSVMSPTAFDVTEEFSVDGGPFKRLGNGHYTKLPWDMKLLRGAALIALPVGAVGTVLLFFRASERTPPLLIVLFIVWLLSPFAVLAWAHVRSPRWSAATRAALSSVTLAITLASLAIYAGVIVVTPPGSPKAAPFVVVAPASWLLIAVVVPLAGFIARRRA